MNKIWNEFFIVQWNRANNWKTNSTNESNLSFESQTCCFQTGHIRTSTGNFFIEPAEKENQDADGDTSPPSPSLLHAIYRLTPPPVTNNVEDVPEPQCGVIYGEYFHWIRNLTPIEYPFLLYAP